MSRRRKLLINTSMPSEDDEVWNKLGGLEARSAFPSRLKEERKPCPICRDAHLAISTPPVAPSTRFMSPSEGIVSDSV